jgi:hypothetical protein
VHLHSHLESNGPVEDRCGRYIAGWENFVWASSWALRVAVMCSCSSLLLRSFVEMELELPSTPISAGGVEVRGASFSFDLAEAGGRDALPLAARACHFRRTSYSRLRSVITQTAILTFSTGSPASYLLRFILVLRRTRQTLFCAKLPSDKNCNHGGTQHCCFRGRPLWSRGE